MASGKAELATKRTLETNQSRATWNQRERKNSAIARRGKARVVHDATQSADKFKVRGVWRRVWIRTCRDSHRRSQREFKRPPNCRHDRDFSQSVIRRVAWR